MPDSTKNKEVRWRQRFQNFNKAFSQLSGAVELVQTVSRGGAENAERERI
jgi:hypothetical protein